MSIFTRIAKKYGWKLEGEPACLNGGFIHKIYKINTEQGTRNSDYEKIIKDYRKRYKNKEFSLFDVVGVTTLFTFYWKQTIDTINYAKSFVN